MPLARHRTLLAACCLVARAAADWTGILGLPFESDKPVEQRAMHCHSGYITGLQVRRGRNSKDDTDFYDFKLKCGSRWGPWSGMAYEADNHKEEKAFECPMKMHMTGLEVKQGRKELGDVDSYDFKMQCSGVWQSYLGLSFSSEKAKAAKECPAGMMAYGWRAYRGFVKRGDKDYYEFDLNCKEAGQGGSEAVRKAPTLREIGLPQNVFVWSVKDVGSWLKSLVRASPPNPRPPGAEESGPEARAEESRRAQSARYTRARTRTRTRRRHARTPRHCRVLASMRRRSR